MLPKVLGAASGEDQVGECPLVDTEAAVGDGDIVSLLPDCHVGRVLMKAMYPLTRRLRG